MPDLEVRGARDAGDPGCVRRLDELPLDPRRAGPLEVDAERREVAEEIVGHPPGVLVPLTLVERVDGVPEPVALPRHQSRAQRLVRVGPEEREAPELEPQPAGHRATRRRSTGTGDRRTRRGSGCSRSSERDPVLWDPGEERLARDGTV